MTGWIAIAAMAENRAIGLAGAIPWHLPEDFKWFKKTTMGHTLVMGRRTFASIGRPLPGRKTIVLTRSDVPIPGVETAHSPEDLPAPAPGGRIFVCGGEEIYRLLLPRCDEVYLTLVKGSFEGDRFLPPFESEFTLEETVAEHPEFRIEHFIRRR